MKRRSYLLILYTWTLALCLLPLTGWCALSADEHQRAIALDKFNAGNFKEAYEAYREVAVKFGNSDDLRSAILCLQKLGREEDIDAFREKVVSVHSNSWHLLSSAAQSYIDVPHYGYIIAGAFNRGGHRGGGRWASAEERDRIRALQLMTLAAEKSQTEKSTVDCARFHLRFADLLMSIRGGSDSWRLQYLSDLSKLPDYEERLPYYGYRSRSQRKGAPVAENGKPVFYKTPSSFAEAQSDGERWRWLLGRAAALDAGRKNDTDLRLANFLLDQFGVQTLAEYQGWFQRPVTEETDKQNESGIYALDTLRDHETIARLATGIKRFTLPGEFDFIRMYRGIADHPQTGHGQEAVNTLAQIYENRRQYDTAAEYWQRSIKDYGPGHDNYKQKKIDQILGNWGEFESVLSQPAGGNATVEYRFRNGTRVDFESAPIDIARLLADVKAYLKSNPKQLTWDKMNIQDIGYRLVMQHEDKYLAGKGPAWGLDLKPRPMHFDSRITVTTPLKAAGAYLVTAKMANGNTSRIVLWINDLILVSKRMDEKCFYFVADAVTGKPIPKANVEFFGYWQEYRDARKGGPEYVIHTHDVAEFADDDGQLLLPTAKFPEHYNWLITATSDDRRLAYMGFAGIWRARYYDYDYNQTRIYLITDHPVYRPNQAVKFKIWVRHARYDIENVSSFARQSFTVQIMNPKGDKVFEKQFTADDYGGFESECPLTKDATLGAYSVALVNIGGAGSFRVEEYKKPEFEVSIDAPAEPMRLGERISGTIKAKYYFGAPVTKATMKYKVTRTSYESEWYPYWRWDWFYGPGFWWYASDYLWYPGWREWGCYRPRPIWWPATRTPPELVIENEAPIGEDGTLKVAIDTTLAKVIHGDEDHRYEITAEVVDQSRRTITGIGAVLAVRKPFKVYAWVDRGHYRVGDVVQADFRAQTIDYKPVKGKGVLNLLKISYDADRNPVETSAQKWSLDTDETGSAHLQLKAAEAGQYRLSYKVTDAKGRTIEGGYVFCVMGAGSAKGQFRFNDLELVPDKREYATGEKVNLIINTDRDQSTVLLFLRPSNGMYLPPKLLHLDGQTTRETIEVTKKDMPNFFIEALTISNGKVYTEIRDLAVPPEDRILQVAVESSAASYRPGAKAKMKLRLADPAGRPFVGSTVLAVYDKALEYISGGSNVQDIKAFFWKWRRHHRPQTESSADKYGRNLVAPGEIGMDNIGLFGASVADEDHLEYGFKYRGGQIMKGLYANRSSGLRMARAPAAAGESADAVAAAEGAGTGVELLALEGLSDKRAENGKDGRLGEQEPALAVQPVVRTTFADTAFWAASLLTDTNGFAEVEFTMPENLTGWKVKTWAMGHGTKVGQAETEVVTTKNLLLRLQAPRFFVEKDEVVLSANIHNYLKTTKKVEAVLELDGPSLAVMGTAKQNVKIAANDEERVDWRVKVAKEGEAVVRMKALTDEESDAMELRFPVYIHGMLKTESFSGAIRPTNQLFQFTLHVPQERRVDESRLEIRYSPTLAGAMVDALPYLVDYPYGCTEQTLNRFLPSVIVQRILQRIGLNLKDIRDKRANLNAQEIGDDQERAKGWQRWDRNPVFDEEIVADMVKEGVRALTAMQVADGGWGWFSGWGEQSWPHTTAYVVHGLQIARENGVALVPGVLERGIEWLKNYQDAQIRMIQNAPTQTHPWKTHPDNLDAFVYMVLMDADVMDNTMGDFLYRDRNELSVYAKAMFGLALYKQRAKDKLQMLLQNIDQYVVRDAENQTAYLTLPDDCWWYWYGNEIEADAYYLKLLARTAPQDETTAGLVKYLLNNRKHATYWNSTRDTALCIEAMADYLRASGEDKPDMTVEILYDGRQQKEVRVNPENLFTFDNKLVLEGKAVETGKHTVSIRKQGTGPLYCNAYLSTFTLEDFIRRAGLEIKVNRACYKLVRAAKTVKAQGSHGQAVDEKVEKYERRPLVSGTRLTSGDLVEIELEIDSKNDYEYLVFEDMKAAGFEPVEVRSGYHGNDMGAYMELRDERVCFFVRSLLRGKHSVAYRMRAEIPGIFSALPTRAFAMYAPELKANSDEFKVQIED
jgi:uncharacterized protein YfaS (alpha-2-macroglobulin family)/tetratricopeptide (TPR) repeat protein